MAYAERGRRCILVARFLDLLCVPSVPSIGVGSPVRCTSSASESECAGSVEMINVLFPLSASFTPIAALVDVFPTPPFPPTKTKRSFVASRAPGVNRSFHLSSSKLYTHRPRPRVRSRKRLFPSDDLLRIFLFTSRRKAYLWERNLCKASESINTAYFHVESRNFCDRQVGKTLLCSS